jgi:hypothetical protein
MDNEQSELAAWLAELEAEHTARALVIASVRQKLGFPADEAGPTPVVPSLPTGQRAVTDSASGPIRSDTFFRLSIPEAVQKYLRMAKRPQSPKDIAAALKRGGVLSQATHFYANVTTALKRLQDAEKVVNTKEGWGLAEWYPNKPRGDAARPKVKPKKRATRRAALASKPSSKRTGRWHQFAGERLAAGKTMKEAAAEWKEKKLQGGG